MVEDRPPGSRRVPGGTALVLLLNLRFGVGDILALLQLLKSQPETAGVPVLVVGDADAATLERLHQLGGTLDILSDEHGTRLRVWQPVGSDGTA